MAKVTYDTDSKRFDYGTLTLVESVKCAKEMAVVAATDAGVNVQRGRATTPKKSSDLPSVNSIKDGAKVVASVITEGNLAGRFVFSAFENGREIARPKSYSAEQLATAWDNFVAGAVLDKSADGALVFYACEQVVAGQEKKTKKISNHALAAAHIKGYC